MFRRSNENIRFDIQVVRSKRKHRPRVSLDLGGDVFYLQPYEAKAMADRLVDIAELVESYETQ